MHTSGSIAEQLVERHGQMGLDLVITVLLNFYESELEIIDLCARWITRRSDLKEKGYLARHMSDEVTHAGLFRTGIERLGIDWNSLNPPDYRVPDISERFRKLHHSDDELEVLIGLNLYAEGVLALEEIEQLGRQKPEYFWEFSRIARDERTHVAFGVTVAKRLLAEDPKNRRRAQEHCDWYQEHLERYLARDLKEKLDWGIKNEFISADYLERTRARFRNVMGDVGLRVSI